MISAEGHDAFEVADTIAEHLVFAWNYCATLRALQCHARSHPDLLEQNAHFFSTFTFALWDSLFLKLAHCSDRRKEALGFPKLFKQLRASLPPSHYLRQNIAEQERRLTALKARSKVEKWRNQVVAHHTVRSEFDAFYKENVCSLDEIESLIRAYSEILHSFSCDLWKQVFCVEDLEYPAREGVDRLVQSMRNRTEQRS
jgi:hypothetical protein